jgi:serine/threonine protein kinase/putative intracellular protease/amidase
MNVSPQLRQHPSPDQLRDFAQGRLAGAEAREVEQHVAACDSCCAQLAQQPEDSLVKLAREVATESIKSGRTDETLPPDSVTKAAGADPNKIPAELASHGRYRVLGLVGIGGMGAVYKAEHRLMERLVALKVINPALIANAAAVERFHREFKAAAKLSHPNIVAAYDAEQAGDLHFLVMEFVEGVSLDRLISQKGRLSVQQACNLIRQAATGLQHAHERGMVHRDIKPHNLMVSRKGQVKILDFGLARLASERTVEQAAGGNGDAQPADATAQGMILGTPDYIAPEQVADARHADIRADIYSLGCTLYYLLTGQPPFPKGSVLDKLAAHARRTPAPLDSHLADVPPELVRILDRMMAKNPAERYQTPGEVAKELLPLTKGQGSAPMVPVTPASEAREPIEASGRRQLPGNSALQQFPNREQPVLSTNDLQLLPDDAALAPVSPLSHLAPLSSLDEPLLASSFANLPSVVRPTPASGFPFQPAHIVAVLIACGAALALMILAWPLASGLFSESERSASLVRESENIDRTKEKLGELSPAKHASLAPVPPATTKFAESSDAFPRRVLLVIPPFDVWGPDVDNILNNYPGAKIDVDIASTSKIARRKQGGTVQVDKILDSSLTADNYGAIIFTGYATEEYHPGGSGGAQAKRLMDEFLAQGKVVASICTGQKVLDEHGLLKNRPVARCQQLIYDGQSISGEWQPLTVVSDDQIITAGADGDAVELGKAIKTRLWWSLPTALAP